MKKLALPLVLLTISYALFFAYVIYSYHALPGKVASHFDLHGKPNGWMSRDSCVGFDVGMAVVLPLFVVAMMAGAGKIPVSFINLPHRDYWLAPERRQNALAVLLNYSLWFACLNVLFMTGVHWLIVESNETAAGAHLNGSHLATVAGGFLAATLAWIYFLVRKFTRIP